MLNKIKSLLPIITVIFCCIAYSWPGTLTTVGTYYIFTYILAYIIGVVYDVRISGVVKRKRRSKSNTNLLTSSIPENLLEFSNWLSNEKFVLKYSSDNTLFLQSKIAIVRYNPGLRQKVQIAPSKINDKRYLVYSENDEIKIKFEDYLKFIVERNQQLVEAESKHSIFERTAHSISNEKDVVIDKLWFLFSRLQGYLFLIIGLINLSENIVNNFCKSLIVVTYLVIDIL